MERLYLVGKCIACKSDLRIGIGSLNAIDLSGETLHSISLSYPYFITISQRSSHRMLCFRDRRKPGYMLVGSLVFKQMAVNMPLTTVWPSADIYSGIGQSEALTNMRVNSEIELKSYMEKLKIMDAEFAERIMPLIDERTMRIKSGQSVQNILNDVFALKESQRKVRSLIKIATKARVQLH